MDKIDNPILEMDAFIEAKNALEKNKTPLLINGTVDTSKNQFIHYLVTKGSKIIVTYSEVRAKEIVQDMKFFEGSKVFYYPSRDIIFYSADVHSSDIISERLEVIKGIIRGDEITVVLSIEALTDYIIEKDVFEKSIINVKTGDSLDVTKTSKQLTQMGYERADQANGRGQFAVRGGIIDIFPITEEIIYRIELWGDEIDSIRKVNAESQRSIGNIDKVSIFPAREIVVSDETIRDAIKNINQDREALNTELRGKDKRDEIEKINYVTEKLLNKVENLGNFNGIEGNIKYYYNSVCSIMDYFDNPTLFIDEPIKVNERLKRLENEFELSMKNRYEKGYLLKRQTDVIYDTYEIKEKLTRARTISFSSLIEGNDFFQYKAKVWVDSKSISPYNSNFEMLRKDLVKWTEDGYSVLLLTASQTRANRLVDMLNEDRDIAYSSKALGWKLAAGRVAVGCGSLHKGFEYPDIKLAVLTETDIIGKKKIKPKKKKNRRNIESFTDLKVGDYIVHENYGVGIFRGIENIEVEGISKDFIKISYKDGGNLYIRTNQLDVIQKYIGAEGRKPRLNKLNSVEWKNTKKKVKAAVEELAKDLVELYAKREISQGHVYGADTVWQREFEELFPYEETNDQLGAIEDTKKDMESSRIMDRLICGDVGYGKTEVAIRAAFKAVQEGKQIAYLVPTTILAQQHYNNFVDRMKSFPVRVEMLSRFKTPKEQKAIINDLKKGLVDIIIGTHRIISKDVQFKDLGLLIIDEEQRFGVTHKEKIKQLKENIDVLTLTATPIPRTLHMGLIGIRDMSLLEEPPKERHPIQTYVLEHNEELIRDAINRELSRNGQVYYVYNRVKDIDQVASNIGKMVGDARVAYAHGQMSERELERIMIDFINGDYDILVSTTIIETGLDIPNVNTIIIQDADRMGLSQLYQLRGRVGRSNSVAFAYLLYKQNKVLQEIAEKRLQAIKEFTQFGSGFKIAMRDLEIRGAGNILGSRQHGHMDAVGYDLYCKLLEQAVNQLSDKGIKKEIETTIDLSVDAYITDKYIKNEIHKIDAYKKIASIENEEDVLDIQDELMDRYGELPRAVNNLLEIALIKALGGGVDIINISQKGNRVVFEVRQDAAIEAGNIPALLDKYKGRLQFSIKEKPHFTLVLGRNKEIFTSIKNFLSDIKETLMS